MHPTYTYDTAEPELTVDNLLNQIASVREQDTAYVLINNADDHCTEPTTTATTRVWSKLFDSAFLKPLPTSRCGGGAGPQDDLLFFVSKSIPPSWKTELTVLRQNSQKLPTSDDPAVDWAQTVCLNLLMQYFVYVLTVAICTRTGPHELQILKKFSETVYASPSRRQMDSKGNREESVYPNLFFSVENYEELFSTCELRDSEYFCVELTAYDQQGKLQGVCFLGTVAYSSLKTFYDSKPFPTQGSNRKGLLGRQFGSLSSYPGVADLPNSTQQPPAAKFMRVLGPESRGMVELAIRPVDIQSSKCHCTEIKRFNMVPRCCSCRTISPVENSVFTHPPSDASANLKVVTRQPTTQPPHFPDPSTENWFPSDDWLTVDKNVSNRYVLLGGLNTQMYFVPSLVRSANASAPLSPTTRRHRTSSSKQFEFQMHNGSVRNCSNANTDFNTKISNIFSRFTRPSQQIENQLFSKLDEAPKVDDGDLLFGTASDRNYMSFGQSWSWFKERRRITSVGLNVALTSITLSSRCILNDLYMKREPILNIMD